MENGEFNFDKKPARKSNSGAALVLIGFAAAIICLVFAGVALVKMGNELKKKNDSAETSADTADSGEERLVSDEVEAKLRAVKSYIDHYYLFDQDDVDYDSAIVKGFVDALGDPYTVYYTPEEYATFQEDNSGEYCGIGVAVQQDPTTKIITVVRVFKDSPAEKGGMKTGDQLWKLDGKEITGTDLNLVVSEIRGEVNTPVTITVYRPSAEEYVDVNCTRQIVQNETVTWEMKEDHIGYIAVSQFEEVTDEQFKKAYKELAAEGMKGLVMDLRGNTGGLLSTVCSMMDFLLPEGVLTYTLDRNGNREEYVSDKDAALDVPMVLLVDGYSASASEVFTGAVRDFGAATVVGTQTFGKGIVQILLPMEDGGGFKVTVSRYYSPSGVCIHGEGFTPDVVIEYDVKAEGDNQLDKAMEIMKEKLK